MGPINGYLGIDCSFVDEEEKALDLKTLQKRGSHLKPSISQGRKPGVFLLVKKLGFKFFKPSCLTIILRSDEATLTQLWQAPSVFESTILRRLSLPRHMHPATSLYSKLCLGGIANHRVKKKIGRQTTHLLLLFCPFTRRSFDLLKPLWMKSLE